MLIRMLDDVWDKFDRYRRVGLQLPPGAEPRTKDFEEHGCMVDLVIDKQPDLASTLMRSHVEHSLTALALATKVGTTALVS